MTTVTGISDHYGRAELVTLTRRDRAPAILDRRSVELIDPGLPAAPYHHEALEMPIEGAERLIERTRRSVIEHCRRAMDELKSSFGVEAVVIQASPFEKLPESLPDVLASRRLTNAADGMLYREELASQASLVGLVVHRIPRNSDPIQDAADALGCSLSEVETILAGFGRTVGAPWRKEHKRVAAAALPVLVVS